MIYLGILFSIVVVNGLPSQATHTKLGVIYKGPNSETIIEGPDGSIITALAEGGSVATELETPPVIPALGHSTNVIIQPAPVVELVKDTKCEETAVLEGPSGTIVTKGSESIIAGPASTTVTGSELPISNIKLASIPEINHSELHVPQAESVTSTSLAFPIYVADAEFATEIETEEIPLKSNGATAEFHPRIPVAGSLGIPPHQFHPLSSHAQEQSLIVQSHQPQQQLAAAHVLAHQDIAAHEEASVRFRALQQASAEIQAREQAAAQQRAQHNSQVIPFPIKAIDEIRAQQIAQEQADIRSYQIAQQGAPTPRNLHIRIPVIDGAEAEPVALQHGEPHYAVAPAVTQEQAKYYEQPLPNFRTQEYIASVPRQLYVGDLHNIPIQAAGKVGVQEYATGHAQAQENIRNYEEVFPGHHAVGASVPAYEEPGIQLLIAKAHEKAFSGYGVRNADDTAVDQLRAQHAGGNFGTYQHYQSHIPNGLNREVLVFNKLPVQNIHH